MNKELNIDSNAILDSSTEVECPNPDCDSTLFYPTTSVRKISGLMTGTGKPGIITLSGPLLCVKCQRPLVDGDFVPKDENNIEGLSDDTSTG